MSFAANESIAQSERIVKLQFRKRQIDNKLQDFEANNYSL